MIVTTVSLQLSKHGQLHRIIVAFVKHAQGRCTAMGAVTASRVGPMSCTSMRRNHGRIKMVGEGHTVRNGSAQSIET